MALGDSKAAEKAGTNGRRVLGLEAADRPRTRKEVEVEGFDGVFLVQEITWDEKELIDLQALQGTAAGNGKANGKLYMPRIVAQGWIHDDGRRVVENAVVGGGEQVARLPHRCVEAMYKAIADLSGFSREAREQMGKGSSGTPNESGSPVSVSSS